jgi:hypothetical protein
MKVGRVLILCVVLMLTLQLATRNGVPIVFWGAPVGTGPIVQGSLPPLISTAAARRISAAAQPLLMDRCPGTTTMVPQSRSSVAR